MNEVLGRLLIVDDEAPVLEVLSEYFTAQGYEVETALSGADALAAVRRRRPDLVLLDIRMPGMDGMEVLRRLQQVDAALAVVMVTANEDLALARETLRIGAFDYVSKPFDFDYLDRVVSAALARAAGAGVATREPESDETAWRTLAVAVFRAARAMPREGREATGARLEAAVLDAAREAGAGRPGAAAARLAEMELLLAVAVELGDLTAAARTALEGAMAAARKTVAAR